MRWCALFGLVCAAAVGGCGSGTPAVHPVKGKITFDGKPMKGGGAISFVPTSNQPGKAAGGEIKDDGTYELMTHKPGDGSMAGEFRVLITQSVEQEGTRTKDGEKAAKRSMLAEADRIPLVYADVAQSPLTATVEAKPNEIDFDLKRAPAKAGARRADPLRDALAERAGSRLVPQPE